MKSLRRRSSRRAPAARAVQSPQVPSKKTMVLSFGIRLSSPMFPLAGRSISLILCMITAGRRIDKGPIVKSATDRKFAGL